MAALVAVLAVMELAAGAIGVVTRDGRSATSGAPPAAAGQAGGGHGPGGSASPAVGGPSAVTAVSGLGAGGTAATTPSTSSASPATGGSTPAVTLPADAVPSAVSTSAGAPGAATAGGAAPSDATGAGTGTPSGPVVACQTDLPLDRSPDTGYNFLCRSGGVPLTWASGTLTFYEGRLSPAQAAALTTAVTAWEQAARFRVVYTSDRSAADVMVTASPLGSGEPGYTEDGYTTVSYRCAPKCAYFHADVTLSSTASLLSTDWVSTLLHELGHVAGLNHVSAAGEVMYPYLTVSSPVVYSAGDQAGLRLLAAERGA